MCGIAGWVDWDRDLAGQVENLEKMSQALVPRGPDDCGSWLSQHAAFVHRRLVVIDPDGGKQPMIRKNGKGEYVIIYNGELYNTQELRNELKELGYHFTGHSDTEVLLTSYMEWGAACLERLNGIFAFAIWSEKEKKLFLARDRLGVKPLFFTRQKTGLLFASELKSILAHKEMEAVINREGLAELIVLGPSRTPGSGIFAGIAELLPGFYMEFTKEKMEIRQYWQLQSGVHTDDVETTIAKVRWLLEDTVTRQLVSDVPVCTFLSGGLDSSVLSAVAAKHYRNRTQYLNTFSVDYLDNSHFFQANDFQPNTDTDWIPLVSDFLKTRHHNIILDSSQLAESLSAAMAARDFPGMADIDSSLLLFCKEIKKNATVAISGECADEIFCGYPWFYREEALNSRTFPWMRMQETRLNFFSPEAMPREFADDYLNVRYRQAVQETPLSGSETTLERKMRQIQYLTISRWMPTLLDRKDRMSMAVGLEVRVPFCDHRLVEYAWNIPWQLKNLGGMEKGILRKAVKGLLPDAVLQRKKSPYPKTYHPEYLRILQQQVLAIIRDKSSPLQPLINVAAVRELATAQAEKMNLPWFGQLMSGPQMLAYLIQFDHWLRRYRVKIR